MRVTNTPNTYLKRRNVDRLFAIWQAIYPDSYTTPQVNVIGTFTDAPGSSEDIDTRMYLGLIPRRCADKSSSDAFPF